MTSFTCSFLFLSFTFSSFGLADPTALKVRFTNHALNMLKDEAIAMFQEQVEGQVFEGFEIFNSGLRNVKITGVNINQAHLSFVENYGFQFVIQNFDFTLNFDAILFHRTLTSAEGIVTGAATNMEVALVRNENGGLKADMRACQASADQIQFVVRDRLRNLEERARRLVTSFLTTAFCPLFRRYAVPFLDRKLNKIPMVVPLPGGLGINFDYTLTRDIQVTATSLDMAVKGLAYRENQPPPVVEKVVEPVFTENTMMAYVGISEFSFNSAAKSLYEAGFLKKDFDMIDPKVIKALRAKQFFTQPRNLNKPLKAEVELTEAPTISITQRDGFIFNMRVRVQVIAPETETPDVLSVSVVCPGSIMVTIEGNRLTLPSKDINCKIVTSNKAKEALVPLLNYLVNKKAKKFLSGWFGEGVVIPLLPEINFIQGNVRYEDGYVVVGGDLRSTPAGRQRLADMARGPRI